MKRKYQVRVLEVLVGKEAGLPRRVVHAVAFQEDGTGAHLNVGSICKHRKQGDAGVLCTERREEVAVEFLHLHEEEHIADLALRERAGRAGHSLPEGRDIHRGNGRRRHARGPPGIPDLFERAFGNAGKGPLVKVHRRVGNTVPLQLPDYQAEVILRFRELGRIQRLQLRAFCPRHGREEAGDMHLLCPCSYGKPVVRIRRPRAWMPGRGP